MGFSTGFTFKQFHVEHDRCAMKVGTDSILLGASAPISPHDKVLDIGCGCGLLCLMLAQQCDGEIDIVGIEIDPQAAVQAQENVNQSPWSASIRIVQGDINDHQVAASQSYDLIISNPPYFIDSLQGPQATRNTARHTDSLSQPQLLANVARLLADEGVFYLILPVNEARQLMLRAEQYGLFLSQCIQVHTRLGKPVHRLIMAFGKAPKATPEYRDIHIYDENNQYCNQFIALTRDFYLNR